MKASNFSDAQKAFIIKQGEEGTPRQLTDDVVRDIYGSDGLAEFDAAITSTAAHVQLRETA